jgi:hypothetical protein
MDSRPTGMFVRLVDQRTLVFEPLALIALVSLATTWAIQPFVLHALVQQGAPAQGAAQAALWLSGVLSPFAAFAKVVAAALICWSCAVFLGERLSLGKLVSIFCVAETVFSLRDATIACVLLARGVNAVRTASDLMVAFGVSAFLHHPSPLQRVGLETWDIFSIAWALLVFWLVRSVFKTDTRSAACVAIVALVFRTLFAAASLLYTL